MKTKRIISVLLALILTLAMLPAAVMAEEAEFPIFDALGITIDLGESDEITRYELAKLVIDIANLEITTEGKAVYVDVSEKHWAFPEINTVTSYGYMNGLSNMTFQPDAKASIADVAQVLMNMLGYGNFGKQANWTTADYYVKARNIGLLKGVSATGGNINASALKQMVANMLSKNIVTVTSVGSDGVKFVVDNEITYLQSVYGYCFKEGKVQAVGKSAITGSNEVSNGKIKISGTTYKAANKDYSSYLGYDVRFVIDKNEENANVLYIEKTKIDEESEIYINASDITDYAGYTYTYTDEDGSTEQASISVSSQIFLNGQKASYDERIMKPLSGGIKLMDNNGDGVFDIVFVTYEIFYEVSGAFENEYISDAIGQKTLDIEKKELYISENGIAADMSAISNEKIIAVMPGAVKFDDGSTYPYVDNANLNRASIETEVEKVSGTVTAKSSSSCVVDETEYKYSKYFEMLVAEGKALNPSINTYVVLYLNSEGYVVYSKLDIDAIVANKTEKYGYITKAVEARGESGKMVVKIFTEDAQFISGETPEKIKINGVKKTATDLKLNTTLFPEGTFDSQLITFETDEAGIVTAINTVTDYTTATTYEGYDAERFSKEFEGSIKYYNTFKHLYTISENTMMFEIPEDLEAEKKFKITTGTKVLGHNKSYYVELYDTDEYYNIATIVVDYNKIAENGGSTESKTIPYNHSTGEMNSFVVYEKTTVLNNEGEERVELTGLTYTGTPGKASGMEVKRLIAEEDDIKYTGDSTFGQLYSSYLNTKWEDLEPGDVIQFRTNDEGYVDIFRLVFKAENMRDEFGNVTYLTKGVHTSATYLVSGVIHKVYADGNFLYRVAAEKTVANINKARPDADQMSNVMIFIYENDTVRQGKASELMPEDSALFISEYGRLYEVIVYR